MELTRELAYSDTGSGGIPNMEQPLEEVRLSRKEAQKLLKIVHPDVWKSNLKAIGVNPDSNKSLTWENIENLLALQLYLKAGLGRHKKSDFAQILQQGKKSMEKTLLRLQVPFELEKKLLARRYQKQSDSKQANRSPQEAKTSINLASALPLTS